MYTECVNNVYKENKGLIWSNLFLTLLIYPIEILLLSWLSGMIFFNQKNFKKFWFFICMFFLAFIIILILKYVREMIDTKIIPSINSNVRLDLFDKTTNKKVGIQSIENGELLIKLQNLPYFIYSGYINSMAFIIPFILTFIAFAGFLFYINWKIGLFSLFYMILYFVLIIFVYFKISKLSYQRHVCEVNQSNEFVDILRNNENISLHNTFQSEKERLSTKENGLQKSFTKELRFISLYRLSIIILIGVYAFIVIFMGYLFVKNNTLPMYKLVILVVALILMIRTFEALLRKFSDTVMTFGPIWNDQKFVNTVNKNQIHFGTQQNLSNYNLEIKNVTYKIDNKIILENINVIIPYQQSVLITGDIGSGKSTLLKMICGYYYTSSGSITFDGVDIKNIDIEHLRNNVTMMHQKIELFKRSVLENIFYGMNLSEQEQMSKLQNLEIYKFLKSFINNPDATTLSGGQKQIVILLRCFFKNPKILILDEPTANLDPIIKVMMIKILNLMKNKCTIICVSHDSQIFSLFEKRFIMKNGQLSIYS